MLDVLALMAPFFGLVLLGWITARRGLLPVDGIGGLMTFVLYFALTALLLRLSAQGRVQAGASATLLLVYALASVLVMALGLGWARRAGLSRRDGALAALVTAFPNTGFLGLPLLTSLLGADAAGPVAATLLIDVLVSCSLAMAWAHSHPHPAAAGQPAERDDLPADDPGPLVALKRSLLGALRNPLLQAMALGLALASLGWTLPKPVDEVLRLLGQAATPAALVTLGAIVARSQMGVRSGRQWASQAAQPSPRHGAASRGAAWVSSLWWLVALKLLAHPALVWLTAQGAAWLGHPLPHLSVLALTLAAALPSAANVSMLAEREGADTDLVARVILWTTAAAVGSLLLWSSLLQVHAAL
ncbi:MAG: AEC family transporter [Proteobacteria bacterium]|uniref:AEC family transporter n=1 Tax=Aquabacterium sp. TaxID=1872578 RepID=UPI0035C70307|nr:AEC family transporter [Pseudomonadota bacterium]